MSIVEGGPSDIRARRVEHSVVQAKNGRHSPAPLLRAGTTGDIPFAFCIRFTLFIRDSALSLAA